MRDRYETEADRENERKVFPVIERLWKCRVTQLPKGSPIDLCLTRDKKVVAMAEFKKRDHVYGQYPTIFVSSSKHVDAVNYGRALNIPVLLIIQYQDCIAWADLSTAAVNAEYGGRTVKTRDQWDTGVMSHIDIKDMRVIHERPTA